MYINIENEEAFTEKLLLVENIDFHLSQTGKLITKVTKHTASDETSKSQQDNNTQDNNGQSQVPMNTENNNA